MKKFALYLIPLLFIIGTIIIADNNYKPNIILITLDTVRADHISFYGNKNIKTPTIDQIAKKSTTFFNAFTPAPMTLPSHCSIFTGLYPQTHNVHDNDIFQLRKSVITLTEFLNKTNYNTAAFVSSIILNAHYGLDQGFDLYDDLSKFSSSASALIERQADTTTKHACNWIQNNAKIPFFIWIHYFDPHFPYQPPPPFSEIYSSNLYDGEIAYTDSSLTKLFDCISKKYDLNNSVIIIAGDHGEGLFQHNEEKHGIFLYNSTTKVPLIIKIPYAKPSIVFDNVSLIDILPTILNYLNIPIPSYIEGTSLLTKITHSAPLKNRALFFETFMPYYTYKWSHSFAIIENNFKYIDLPIPELYNLEKDNDEIKNLFNDKPEIANKLKKKLNNFFSKTLIKPWEIKHFFSSSIYDEDIREKLKSLGYISAPAPSIAPTYLPDPKNMVSLLIKLNTAQDYYNKSLYDEALNILKEIIAKDENNGPALSLLSDCLIKINKYNDALTYILKAIQLYPNNDSLIISAAFIYNKLGKFKEAESFLLKSISINPNSSKAYAALINLYVSQNYIDKASEIISKINNNFPASADIYFSKALFFIRQNKINEAKLMLEKGTRLDPNNANAIANLAKIYYLENQIDKAINLYEKYLTLVPDNAEINAFLAAIYWNNKHNKIKSQELLTKALNLNPNHPQANQWLNLLNTIKNAK